ncbi:hypothetical protein AB0K16_30305 [Nonomuraea jabiensis]|uniref:hypothetical protein n=1 Tax=Nonomuraea jabiensis TaxID=882448 RepID=UPI003412446C
MKLSRGQQRGGLSPRSPPHARDLGATTYEGALGDDVPAEWRAVGAAVIRPDGHHQVKADDRWPA